MVSVATLQASRDEDGDGCVRRPSINYGESDMSNRALRMILLAGLMAAGASGPQACGETAGLAQDIVEKAGISRGVCCVLGHADSELPLELTNGFLVHALDSDESAVAAMRAAAEDRGLALDRFVAEATLLDRLPHADNVVDLLVAVNPTAELLGRLSAGEVLRALRPRAKAVLLMTAGGAGAATEAQLRQWAPRAARMPRDVSRTWVVFEKPRLDGAANWSHWEHAPDNNAVSEDTVITAPYMTQYMAQPYYIAMPAVTTAAGGRTFVAMGHIAHHEREEPWLNTILARNGYNGAELWRKRLPDGYLVHRSAFVATDDVFYMIDPDGNGCLMVDPETGEPLDRIRIPEAAGEWKWMVLHEGVLYALAGRERDPAETTIVRSLYHAWSWGELSRGYYEKPRIPWGFGETIVAYDLDRRSVLWVHEEAAAVDSRAMALGGGKVFFYAPDARLGCLDARTGEVVWTNDDAEVRKLIEQPGRGLGSTPGFRTTCCCVYTPKGLFYQAQTRQNVVAVSVEDGRLMWHRNKTTNNPNVIYLDGQVLVGIGPEGNTLMVEPGTGETIKDLGFRKRSCVRLTATSDSIFCRGWPEGLTRYDRASDRILFDGSMRPACNDGVIGANGLLYVGPWLCDCNLSLMGTVAMCSAQDYAPAPAAQRLQALAEDLAAVAAFEASESDWSAYRGGSGHTASAPVSVAGPIQPMWHWEPDYAFTPTAPVSAGGLVLLAGDDGRVRALDDETGRPAWEFATAGAILQPPTVWEGRAYVGSGDGFVYALEAATGRPLWRFQAAPVERRIMAYGALASTWPVNSGVLVNEGVAYFAAGIIDFDGTYVYAVDAVTGQLKWQNGSTGHLDGTLRKGVSAQGNLTVVDDALWMAGGNVVSGVRYALETGEYLGGAPDDGSPRANRGEEIGVFAGEALVCGGRLRYSGQENVVNPGRFTLARAEGKGGLDLAVGRSVPAWDAEPASSEAGLMVVVPEREAPPVGYAAEDLLRRLRTTKTSTLNVRPLWRAQALADSQTIALALAADAVVAACRTPQPRNLTPRWRVCLLSRADGTVACEHDLWQPIRPNGLAIDRDGRVLVVMADGGVRCLGGRKAFQAYLFSLVSLAETDTGRQKAVERIRHTLNSVHDPEGRAFLLAGLEKLGVDVYRAAREHGAVTDWRLLGPVPWDAKHPMDKRFVREPKVKLGRTVRLGDARLAWAEYTTIDANGMVDLAAVFGPHDSDAVYAYAEVELAEAGHVLLKVGSNDGYKCWFNGREAGRFDGGRTYRPDQDTLKVRAKAGANTLLLKVTQMGGGWALGARLTDLEGKPLAVKCVTP